MSTLEVLWDGVIFATPSVSSYGLAYSPHKWPHSQRPPIKIVKDRGVAELVELDPSHRLNLKSGMCINLEDISDIVPDICGSKLHDKPYLWIKLHLSQLRKRGLIKYWTCAYHLRKVVKTGYFPLVRTKPGKGMEKLRKKFKNLPEVIDNWPDYDLRDV
jgi:hypothetical protein